jgi:hypothetical protein
MEYYNETIVWVGVDVSTIMMLRGGLFKEKGEFYSYYHENVNSHYHDRNYAALNFHNFVVMNKIENYDEALETCHGEDLMDDWVDICVERDSNGEVCLYGVPISSGLKYNKYIVFKPFCADLRVESDIGWGIEICSDLTNEKDPKAIYNRAEKLQEVYKKVIKKYFSGEEAEILIDKMKIHTDAIVV